MSTWHDRAADDSGVTHRYQNTDYSYLADYTDEQIMAIVRSDPTGTDARAEKVAARFAAVERKLIKQWW